MPRDLSSIEALNAHVRRLRKRYGRRVGHKPTGIETDAMDRAAMASALLDQALLNPAISVTDKHKLEGMANRALRRMATVLVRKPAETKHTLASYAAVVAKRNGKGASVA